MSYQKTYTGQNYSLVKLEDKEFEECVFRSCDFSNYNFTSLVFINCVFENCNLSMAKLSNTSFQKVLFRDSKMLGLNFDSCKDFGLALRFENCLLDFTSFARKKLPNTLFKACKINESNFDQTDLTKASFEGCDLRDTLFDRTILNGCDFSTAKNFLIDPQTNSIKKAKFSRHDLMGLLYRHDIVVD